MSWIEDTQKAIKYIEANLHTAVGADDIAHHIGYSSDYFQRIFQIITGVTVSEYIRNRKLSLAGQELAIAKNKVIDIALKYGYETPESFTKAFARFHGFSPSKTRSFKNQLKLFKPLTIEITVKGGFDMEKNVAYWDEHNAETSIHNNGLTDFMVFNPSLELIEETLDNLGKSEEINSKSDYDFIIFDLKNPPLGNHMYMQTVIEKDSDKYEVFATYFNDLGNNWGERVECKTTLTDVEELKRLFTAFSLGIAPDTSGWSIERVPLPPRPPELMQLASLFDAGLFTREEYLEKIKLLREIKGLPQETM